MDVAHLRRTVLCLLLIFLSLPQTESQRPKDNQYGWKEEKRPWWKSIIDPIDKPLRTIQSAHLLLVGHKADQGRGLSNRVLGDVRRVPETPSTKAVPLPMVMTTPSTTASAILRTTPSKARPTEATPSTPTSSSTTAETPHTLPGDENSLKVRMNLRRFMDEPCGVSLESRIINGEETMPGEFPWLALLQVRDVYFGRLKFICGATLINDRYVLTAAHCVQDFRYEPVSVRLGEYNTETEDEVKACSKLDKSLMSMMESEICRAESPKDYPVEKKIVHPQYAPGRTLPNDIALVRLKSSVEFTYYVAPVCLPIGDIGLSTADIKVGINTTVAGWGMTEKLSNSPVPLKASLPLMDYTACKRLLTDMIPGKLCVGDNMGSSPCFGDSGGPIILRTMMFPFEEDTNEVEENIYTGYTRSVLLGVVSSGPGYCNIIQPTLSTSVQEYIIWILQNIDP